ncbi:hypothetical protein V6N12_062257 [Hibiscus sabdariffa]|uniref:Uncharacterized protein n=1 Tax=Hibiscus sabdariffa TaxID=183260 RepID=A0ABR2F8D4_9ROSI
MKINKEEIEGNPKINHSGLKLVVSLELLQYPSLELQQWNAVANQVPWVFPHVKRQLALESTCITGIGSILSFTYTCPLVHQCCSNMLLTILPGMLQHLFLLNPRTCSPAHHH